MKTKWTKEIPVPPSISAWYWIKYKGKYGTNVCPCRIYCLRKDMVVVRTANGDAFTSENQKKTGFSDALFGPRIAEP